MENQLIHIYLFVCQTYDTSSTTCFQRLSNNSKPDFTDQELLTIWFFAHLQGCFEKKKMHDFILNYWHNWFPLLPGYQTFVLRLNQLEPTFQTFGTVLSDRLAARHASEADHIVDSLPVMLATPWSFLPRAGGARGGGCRLLCCQKDAVSRCALALDRTASERTLAASQSSVAVRSLRA